MVQAFDIPLKQSLPQSFLVTLVGVDYRFTFQWRDVIKIWILDIRDVFGAPLVCGIPLVAGANLVEQFSEIPFGGELWIMTDGSLSDPPTFDSLGFTSHLRFIVDGTVIWKFT